MPQLFLGSITLFAGNFAPVNYAFCNGQLLPINQNQALFSLLGTTYGGDGQVTFALPDLQGRVPIHFGAGSGLSNYTLGDHGGVESVTLNVQQMPAHSHSQPATGLQETTNRPNGGVPAQGGVYAAASDGVSNLSPTTQAGGNQPHSNVQPYLAINYIIALTGIFPSRN